jgi:hypothetical protein
MSDIVLFFAQKAIFLARFKGFLLLRIVFLLFIFFKRLRQLIGAACPVAALYSG